MVALKLACIELTRTNISRFESHHPLEHKVTVIWTLFHRANTVKDYRDHDFPNTEFSYFLTIDPRH